MTVSEPRVALAIAAATMLVPSAALSQVEESAKLVEEIVVTGTRKEGLTPTQALSPVDILVGAALADQAAFDMTDGLTRVSPSINTQRFPVADGTAFIRPVSMRNLSPDQTLVLVDGTRRHRSPLVNLQFAPLGTVNQGAHAVDFATLPTLAIKRIEVLRDGASAQYGSDAIAGVVNVILKDARDGLTVSGQFGEYFAGDGTRTTIAANGGFALGDGFLNVTVEHSSADTTSRGGPFWSCPAVSSVVGRGAVPLDGNCIRWGDPDIEALKLFVNFGVDVSDTLEIFATASYSDNDTISDFVYREPVLPPGAMIPPRDTLMVDLDSDFLPDPAAQSLVDSITAAGLNPADYLTADAGSPSGFVLLNPIYTRFPGGYNPDFGAALRDYAVVLGTRGETRGGLSWDMRARFADAEVEYVLSETINPSLGILSPTSFRPGKLVQEETALTADFVKAFDIGALASPLNLAFGAEYREETYVVGAGDPDSIVAGPGFVFGVGSDGFQGFPIESAGSFASDSIAVYIDIEADFNDRFSGGAAIRFEDYDTFGETFDWKLSGRVQVTDNVALRATVNTGFHAPTPGQVNTLNVTTSADQSGNLIPSGVYPVNHPVAVTLGSRPLTPEESTAFTLGAIFQPTDRTSITLDYYDIEIEDRLALAPNIISAADVTALTNAGVPNAGLLQGSLASYFTNAFDSNVTGIDLTIASGVELGSGTLNVELRHNYNDQEVGRVAPATIDQSRVFDLENHIPNHRTTLTFDYQHSGMFSGYLRLNRFDEWASTEGLFSPGDASDAATYGSEILVDVEASLTFNERYKISVGGDNVFDVDPDPEQGFVLNILGVTKSLTSPFGFNGGFWYARVSAEF